MKKLNNKGYMLVEIILASVIAFSVAYYLINLTVSFKNKSEDVYYSTAMLSDKINITKAIMNVLIKDNYTKTSSINNSTSKNAYVILNKGSVNVKISLNGNTIEFGSLSGSSFNKNDVNIPYYTKTLSNYLEFDYSKIKIANSYIIIPVNNIYSKISYEIKIIY